MRCIGHANVNYFAFCRPSLCLNLEGDQGH
jgi:hypothetical protein